MSALVVLAAIVALGVALRFYGLDQYSLWYDEVSSIETVQRGIGAIFTQRFGWVGNQTQVYYLVLWLMTQFADPTTTAVFVRLPQVLAGALVPLVVYAMGRDMFGRAQGLLACLLTALSAPLIDRSQDARPYSITVLFTVLSVYCLWRAGETQQGRWWFFFALSASANLLFFYAVTILVMPALGVYILFLLRQVIQSRPSDRKLLASALASLLLVGVVGTWAMLELTRVSRAPLDLSRLDAGLFIAILTAIYTWFTRFGMDARWQMLAQSTVGLLALMGAYLALRQGGRARQAAYVCGLLSVVPAVTLTILSASSLIFARYVLFCVPFYLLLASHGTIALLERAYNLRVARPRQVAARALGSLPVVLLLGMFALGAYNLHSPSGHLALSLRPDFRGEASYLSQVAKPEDTIVFVDEPTHGVKVSNFYWKNDAPATVFSVADPRMFAHTPRGDIYWVFWAIRDNPNASDAPWKRISAFDQGWAEVAYFGDVVVLRETGPSSMLASTERMATRLEAVLDEAYLAPMVRGCVLQAKGDLEGAVAAYKRSVPDDLTLADEDLRTANGFEAIGMKDEAWHLALISKFDKPSRPEIHRWLSQKLAEQGYLEQSRTEQQLAEMLAR